MSRLPFKPAGGYKWFHATRALGCSVLAYGLLVDDTPERGSIILGGFGLLGLEKVARGEEAQNASDTRKKDKATEGDTQRDSSTGT